MILDQKRLFEEDRDKLLLLIYFHVLMALETMGNSLEGLGEIFDYAPKALRCEEIESFFMARLLWIFNLK